MSDDIVERLRATGCDFEPFTAEHRHCKCRLANEAADEIERLRSARASAFEEAAKIADEQFGAIQRDPEDYIGKQRHSDSWDQCAFRIAAAIREHARRQLSHPRHTSK